MEDIKITENERGCFFVEQGNKVSDELGYDEMLGLVTVLTMPERLCLQWMKEKTKYKPKDGDFVVSYDRYIAICKHPKVNDVDYCFESYAYYDTTNAVFGLHSTFTRQEIVRPATNEEKELLLSKLHKIGKDWNGEKKEIVDYQWIPQRDENYWSLEFDEGQWKFVAVKCCWYTESPVQIKNKAIFKTKEEAERDAERRNKYLNKYSSNEIQD